MRIEIKKLFLALIVAAAFVALLLIIAAWLPLYEGWTGKEMSKNCRSKGDCRVVNIRWAAEHNATLVFLRGKIDWHVFSVVDGYYNDYANGKTAEKIPYDGSPVSGYTPACEIRIRDYRIAGYRLLLDDTDALYNCSGYYLYTYFYLFSYRLKKSVSH